MKDFENPRLELAVYIKEKVLPELKVVSFIENGSLLGAHRNGKFIQGDDDFDFAVLIEEEKGVWDVLSKIGKLVKWPYEARFVQTYAIKVEVFDPRYGKHKLEDKKYQGADFHNVTCDLQLYIKQSNGLYRCMYFVNPRESFVSIDDVLPIGEIELEGIKFPAPNNIEKILTDRYGSLREGAKYDAQTGLYID